MVPPDEETLNSLFEELADWNQHLSAINIDFDELDSEHEHADLETAEEPRP